MNKTAALKAGLIIRKLRMLDPEKIHWTSARLPQKEKVVGKSKYLQDDLVFNSTLHVRRYRPPGPCLFEGLWKTRIGRNPHYPGVKLARQSVENFHKKTELDLFDPEIYYSTKSMWIWKRTGDGSSFIPFRIHIF